jgi:hypothetical protein
MAELEVVNRAHAAAEVRVRWVCVCEAGWSVFAFWDAGLGAKKEKSSLEQERSKV